MTSLACHAASFYAWRLLVIREEMSFTETRTKMLELCISKNLHCLAGYIHYGNRIQSQDQHMIALFCRRIKRRHSCKYMTNNTHCNTLFILLFCRSSLVRSPREVFLTCSSSSSSSSSLCNRTLAHGISTPS